MSARYVWEKYNTASNGYKTETIDGAMGAFTVREALACTSYIITIDENGNAIFKDSGYNRPIVYSAPLQCSTYPYLISLYKPTELYHSTEGYWGTIYDFSQVAEPYVTHHNSKTINTSTLADYERYTIELVKGDFLGYVSSALSNAYRSEGIGSDRYYYKYVGSDSIDPTAINYSSQNPDAGEYITVTVTPRSNSLGGTIYYQYFYSVNNGAWSSAGNKTTDKSISILVPETAQHFQVRVQASDDIGFTSTDYVTGANLEVQQMRGYMGVNGKARKVDKLYIGVNGKARQVTRGYIGVNGKARRFL